MGISRNCIQFFNGVFGMDGNGNGIEWGKQVGGFSICNAMLTNCLSVQVFMKFFVPGKPKCYEKI